MTSNTRSPEEIEREIERERASLTSTLDDLQDRFSFDTITRQMSEQFREHSGDIGRSLTDAVKRNPTALALTGIGLAWLMLGSRDAPRDTGYRSGRTDGTWRDRDDDTVSMDRGRMPDPARPTPPARPASRPDYSTRSHMSHHNTPSWAQATDDDTVQSTADRLQSQATDVGKSVSGAARDATDATRKAGKSARDGITDAGKNVTSTAKDLATSASDRAAALRTRLAEGTQDLSDEARERVIAAREYAVEARDAALTYAKQGRDKAADMFDEQPLIAGALAVALGAAIGTALPRSKTEDAYLGERSDALMAEAERIFDEEKQKLSKVAKAAADEARHVIEDGKETADQVARDAAKTVTDKARSSGQRVADAARDEAKKQKLGDVAKS